MSSRITKLITNKKYVVKADVFRTIVDICPRVEGVDFTDVPHDDTTLAFLIELGYKGPLYKQANMFVDHMHQPWRTLATIINKCLSGKTASNVKLRKLIIGWRRDQDVKICHFPDSPKSSSITSSINTSLSPTSSINTIIQSKMMELCSSNTPLVKFLQRKGSQGKKTIDTHVADVDVSKESDPEAPKRKTASRRVVKKKVTIFADDNIISDDPDITLELGKSISKIEAEEAEAARQVNATHARIVTEFVSEPTRKRKSSKVTSDPPKRLKGVPSLTLEEQEAVDIMQSLKESKKDQQKNSVLVSQMKELSEDLEEGQLDDEEKDDKDGDADDEDVDAEMADAETVKHKNKEKDVLTDAGKPDVEKNAKEEGYAEKDVGSNLQVKESTEFPLPSSSLSISFGFETTNLPPIPEILTKTIVSTAVSSPYVTPTISTEKQTSTPIPTPPIPTNAPTSTSVVPESDALNAIQLRVIKLEKDVSKLKKIDLSTEALAALKTQVPSIIDNYLGSKVRNVFQKELKKHTAYLILKYSLQRIPKLPKNQTPIVDLEQEGTS
ncbi:hypothetical protein Tco_1490951 [Tanacetum coccineum]